jgi:hypothetical protein
MLHAPSSDAMIRLASVESCLLEVLTEAQFDDLRSKGLLLKRNACWAGTIASDDFLASISNRHVGSRVLSTLKSGNSDGMLGQTAAQLGDAAVGVGGVECAVRPILCS